MAAEPAYRYSYPEQRPEAKPSIRVVPGRGRKSDTLPSAVILYAKILAVVFVGFALLGFVRIGLASATVTTALSSEALSSQLEAARSTGNSLEVRESYLSNPTYIKTESAKLGMVQPSETASLSLAADIVSTDAQGNLSLSKSLAVTSQG